MKFKPIFFVALVQLCVMNSFGQATAVQEFNDGAGNFYNYCPSYVQISGTVRYMYYCKNPNSNQIIDYVYWRKATLSGSTWTWGAQQVALTPAASGWDHIHTCDPDVKQGSFAYNGHTYTWIMFYLGTDQLDNNHNQVGIALADSPEGPWIKWGGNPLITFSGTNYWGVGQPSATSVDGLGRLLLFYSKGDATGTKLCRRDIDLANLSTPTIGTEYALFTNGLTSRDNNVTPVVLHNAGFSYDAATDRMYVIRERGPNDVYDPSFVSTQLQVAYTAGANIWNNSGSWTVEGQVSSSHTGRERNHNGGFLTNQYGVLTGGASNYTVSFTGSYIGSGNLWSYRIFRMDKTGLTNFYPAANSIYELRPRHAPAQRLDVAGGTNADGTNVQIYQSNSNNAQRWKVTTTTNGYFALTPQCCITRRLDVYNAGTTNGTNVQIWTSTGANAQQWRIIDKTGVEFELAPRHASGMRLDVAGGGTTNGTNVQIYQTNENYAQQWEFLYIGQGALSLSEPSPQSGDENAQLSVFPNPAADLIHIKYLPKNSGSLRIEIFDLKGKLISTIFSGQVKKAIQQRFQFQRGSLAAGIYFINCVSGPDKIRKEIVVN